MSFDILKASPRGLESLLAHNQLLRRMKVVVVESGEWGKWTNGAITAARKCSDRKSKADEPEEQ